MKILLLEKKGQVGWEFQRALSVFGEVVALDRYPAATPYGELKVDLSDLGGLKTAIRAASPQRIVNAAAYTAVDKAESGRDVIEFARGHYKDLVVQRVNPIGTTDYPPMASRSLSSRLDTIKFRKSFNLHLPEWQSGVTRMLMEALNK